MVIVLLTFIGISLWLIAGAFLFVMRRRRLVMNRAGAFKAKVRATSDTQAGVGMEWSSGTAWWVSNVLVLTSGIARSTYTLLPVARTLPEAIHSAPVDEVKRMGTSPQIIPFLLDPSGAVEVVVDRDDVPRALGPFLGQIFMAPDQTAEQTHMRN
jgi:hypothetical protein